MRPLDEVLAAAREPHPMCSDSCPQCADRRRELEEWESALQIDVSDSWVDGSTTEERAQLRQQLASVRQLLGRGEPVIEMPPDIRELLKHPGLSDAAKDKLVAPYRKFPAREPSIAELAERLPPERPRPASPAMRALVEACEAAHGAIDVFLADQSYATDPRCGLVQPVTVDDCNELGRAFNLLGNALALARAELGEEAEHG